MTNLPICGATWNGVGLTYICDQAPGHTGRHYAGHDGERIGWQPDTPATCGSRYRGPHHTYTCKRTPAHDGGHADQYPSGAVLATWTDAMAMPVADWAEQAENDAARTATARWERLYRLTQDRLSEQIRSTQKARQQRNEARENARVAERRAEHAEARAAMAEAAADLRTQRVGQLERSRDCWKRRAIQAQDDRDRYAAQATRLRTRAEKAEDEVRRIRRGGLYRQIRKTAGYPLPTDATQEDRAVQEFARDLERWIPQVAGEELSAAGAAPDLTTPVSPREKTPARNDHPLWDLLDAITGPAISNDDAITSAPPADDTDRKAYATEQVQRAVRHLAGSTTNADLWARIGMTLGWTPEHARDVARHRRLAGETDLSVKLTAAREQIKALLDARDHDRATLTAVRRALNPDGE